jgi:hypothetical protein
VRRIVSGGQSGVDRAALDVARALGIPYGGWCPAGGWAEDLITPPGLLPRYPLLTETPSTDPAERTTWNVRDSDATLVVSPGPVSGGTALTARTAESLGRPLLVTAGDDVAAVVAWLRGVPLGATLNVAGPRHSQWADGYRVTRALLEHALGPWAGARA